MGQPVPCMILRPKDGRTYFSTYDKDGSMPEGDDNTHMLVHRGKVVDLYNSAFKAHKNLSPNCMGDLVRGFYAAAGFMLVGCLKESSHMISMLMLLFEIITSHSLYTRSKVMW